MPLRTLLAVCLLLPLGALAARAGGPTTHEVAGHEAFAQGTLDGLALDAEGVLRLGPALEARPLEAETAWCHARSGGALWIGLGGDAGLVRVADGDLRRVPLEDGLMVTALAPLPGGAVAAAVFPGSRLVKVDAEGNASDLARIPAEYVWDLDAEATGALTVASGVPAALWRVDPMGAVAKVVEVDDQHARCLARDATGRRLLVGTAPKGLVLALEDRALRVVRDLAPQEVVGIVPLPDGSLIVAANADQAGGNAQKMASLLRQVAEPGETKKGDKPAPRQALQDGVLLHLEAGGAVTELWSATKQAVLSLAPDGAGAVAGTYPSARVVGVAPGRPHALLADLPEAEASVVASRQGTFDAVVTSNPAVLHVRRRPRETGAWTSAPLDAGTEATWGRLTLWGEGVRGLRWRAGPTEEPDDAWTPWQALAGFDGEAGSVGHRARFLQIEATLAGAEASLRRVALVRRTPNRAPTLADLGAKHPGRKQPDAVPTASSERVLSWKAEDPDGDRLRTRIEASRRGSPRWDVLVEDEELDKPQHAWDTVGLPDGLYRVRVTVTDAPDNPPDRARSATAVLPAVRVDNTPPALEVEAGREGGRLVVRGTARDARGGRVLQVRASVDGGPWVVLGAQDGLFDSDEEAFAGTVAPSGEGPHDVVVQATDAEGNLAAAATVVR